jgi:DNA-binding winged helix-turn-helix (wHTH) protein
MHEENQRIYEFGDFRLDPRARLLLRDGQPVALTPKVFDTLLLMVQHHGQLLEKEQLMQALWAHSFVEESNLTYNISTLRKALGEKAARQPFIVTVPGHGYRFVAEVRVVILKGAAEAESHVLQLAHRKLKRRVFLAAGLLLIFAILLFFWLAYLSRANSSSPT